MHLRAGARGLPLENVVIENRRSRRKSTQSGIEVTNALTEEVIGQVGNLSVDGMLLIANREMADDGLFQLRFDLPGQDPGVALRTLEIGVHEQWAEPASTPGQFWAGFRIIDIAPDDRVALAAWVERHEADI